MNCVPITVANNLPSNAFDDIPKQSPAFPPIFVTNINGCITRENVDIRFPSPRSIVKYNSNRNNLLEESEPVYSRNPTFSLI